MKLEDVRIGDWVRYRWDAHLVIGSVVYTLPANGTYQNETCVVTEHGDIPVSVILEVRRGPGVLP